MTVRVNVEDIAAGDVIMIMYPWANAAPEMIADVSSYGGLTVAALEERDGDANYGIEFVHDDPYLSFIRINFGAHSVEELSEYQQRWHYKAGAYADVQRAAKSIVSVVVTYDDGSTQTLPTL